jgi:hypothetical protein
LHSDRVPRARRAVLGKETRTGHCGSSTSGSRISLRPGWRCLPTKPPHSGYHERTSTPEGAMACRHCECLETVRCFSLAPQAVRNAPLYTDRPLALRMKLTWVSMNLRSRREVPFRRLMLYGRHCNNSSSFAPPQSHVLGILHQLTTKPVMPFCRTSSILSL